MRLKGVSCTSTSHSKSLVPKKFLSGEHKDAFRNKVSGVLLGIFVEVFINMSLLQDTI